MLQAFNLVLSLLLVSTPAFAQLECVVTFNHHAEASAHYSELAAAHPEMAGWNVLKNLPWKKPEQGVFTTEPLGFANRSTWQLSIQPSGKMNLQFRINNYQDDYHEIFDEMVAWADYTVDGKPERLNQGEYSVLVVKNITDTDLVPSETATSQGRRIFLERLVESFYGSAPPAIGEIAGKEAIPAVVRANAQLGTAVSKPLAKAAARANQNFFFSPYSLSTAWTMVTLGASPATQAEMLKLYGGSIDAATLQTGASALKQSLFPAGQDSLVTANSIWMNRGVRLLPEYQQEMKSLFGAEVQSRDLGQQSTVNEINGWIEKNTHGLVKDVIKRPDSAAVFYLINTLGVKVKWKNAFDVSKTQERPFTRADGSVKRVPMMFQKGKFNYVQNSEIEGVSLETAEGEVVLDFYLPKKGQTAEQMAESLDIARIQQWASQFKAEQKGKILLPRLKLEYRTELVDTIRSLGIQTPFLAGPNLTRIVDGNTQISSIIQQTFLEVDEAGAKAGAATVVAATRGISMDPVDLDFNRPFILAIRHRATNEVLFTGLISNP